MKKMKLKRKIMGTLSMLALLVAVIVPVISHPRQATALECKARNVITCGVNDRAELVANIRNDAGLRHLFATMGIYADDVASVDAVGGIVKRDGSVWVGNTQVATGTIMGQRGTESIEGANTPWAGLNWAYTNIMFGPDTNQQAAFVYMRDGQFLYAIVLSCGNPVLRQPAPFPPGMSLNKNVRNITADTNSTFAKSTNAKPGDTVEFRMEIVDISKVTVEEVVANDTLPAHLTLVPGSAHAQVKVLTASGWQEQDHIITDAKIASGQELGNFRPTQNSFVYLRATAGNDIPDGCTNVVNTGSAKARQISSISSTASVNICKTTPTPPPPTPPVTPPTTPPTVTPGQPTSLPTSGPVEAAGGVMGTGALGYAGYLWRRSRKTLMNTLLNK